MNAKVLEIRDRATHIGVMAIKMLSDDPAERYELRRSGYGEEFPLVTVIKIDGTECHYNEYAWGTDSRTMFIAHQYINEHFDELNSGDVIDVEYILNEVKIPKKSENLRMGE